MSSWSGNLHYREHPVNKRLPQDSLPAALYGAKLAHARGDFAKERRRWQDALTRGGEGSLCHFSIGETFSAEGKDDEAKKAFERANKADPAGQISAYIHLAEIARREGRPDQALDVIRRGLAVLATDRNLLDLMVTTLLEAGKIDEARRYQMRYLAASANDPTFSLTYDDYFKWVERAVQLKLGKLARLAVGTIWDRGSRTPALLLAAVEIDAHSSLLKREPLRKEFHGVLTALIRETDVPLKIYWRLAELARRIRAWDMLFAFCREVPYPPEFRSAILHIGWASRDVKIMKSALEYWDDFNATIASLPAGDRNLDNLLRMSEYCANFPAEMLGERQWRERIYQLMLMTEETARFHGDEEARKKLAGWISKTNPAH